MALWAFLTKCPLKTNKNQRKRTTTFELLERDARGESGDFYGMLIANHIPVRIDIWKYVPIFFSIIPKVLLVFAI